MLWLDGAFLLVWAVWLEFNCFIHKNRPGLTCPHGHVLKLSLGHSRMPFQTSSGGRDHYQSMFPTQVSLVIFTQDWPWRNSRGCLEPQQGCTVPRESVYLFSGQPSLGSVCSRAGRVTETEKQRTTSPPLQRSPRKDLESRLSPAQRLSDCPPLAHSGIASAPGQHRCADHSPGRRRGPLPATSSGKPEPEHRGRQGGESQF